MDGEIDSRQAQDPPSIPDPLVGHLGLHVDTMVPAEIDGTCEVRVPTCQVLALASLVSGRRWTSASGEITGGRLSGPYQWPQQDPEAWLYQRTAADWLRYSAVGPEEQR